MNCDDSNVLGYILFLKCRSVLGNHNIITDVNGIGSLNPLRYRGYYFDDETGLYHLSTRYYDPETGRFINADDITILDESRDNINGLNLYAYCSNNPIMFIDPSGQFWDIFKKAADAIGGVWGGIVDNADAIIAITVTALAIAAIGAELYYQGVHWHLSCSP